MIGERFMTEFNINDYREERSCTYRGEEYLVRDNGAVLRKSRLGGRRRKCDDVWTLGNVNKQKGYYDISSEPVHRIVATAFHGEPPTETHVVDHIDSNKQNNRPENLRWVTRLENAVLNEVTRKKIEYRTGVSIHEFLMNPSRYRDKLDTPDFSWMRSVTEQEGRACLANMQAWSKKESVDQGDPNRKIDEWIYHCESITGIEQTFVTNSLTPQAKQKDWKTPTRFVCCPEAAVEEPIRCYMENLSENAVFATNSYGETKIVQYALADDGSLVVMTATPSPIKPYGLIRITFEDGLYIHTSMGSFMLEESVKKYYLCALGLQWSGDDCIDDYC